MTHGLTKVPDGEIPVTRDIKSMGSLKVIDIYRVRRDRTVNDDLEEHGASLALGAGGDEAQWYQNHKGYSKWL